MAKSDLTDLLAAADLTEAQELCKTRKRSLTLDRLLDAASRNKDREATVWLARRAMDARPAKKPRWTRPEAVAISGSLEDLEATIDAGDDWFATSRALKRALNLGHDAVLARVLQVAPQTPEVRRMLGSVLTAALHLPREVDVPGLTELAALSEEVAVAAALRGQDDLFVQALERLEGPTYNVVGALIVCEPRFVGYLEPWSARVAELAGQENTWWSLAHTSTSRWINPLPEHTSEVGFQAANLAALIDAGLTPSVPTLHHLVKSFRLSERPHMLERALGLAAVVLERGELDLNVEIKTGEAWDPKAKGYADVRRRILEDALEETPLEMCELLYAHGARLAGPVAVGAAWSEREAKGAWLESLGQSRETSITELLTDELGADLDYAELVATLLADPSRIAGVGIGTHADEARALGFEVRDEWISLEGEVGTYSPGGQSFECVFEGEVARKITYTLYAHGSKRMNEARDAFVDALTAAHGKPRGTKNITWRFGRTKCVVQAKSVFYGGVDTLWRVRVEATEL
jgi:hypothetical protein